MLALCHELATEAKPLPVRQMAGLHIKNMIHSKNPTLAVAKQKKWSECDAVTKETARGNFLQALASPHREVGRVAAQIIANYGSVDVSKNEWPGLMDTLFTNVTHPEMAETTKVSSLEVR